MTDPTLHPILLVEDNPRDIELVRTAFEELDVANPLIVTRDGVEALDYLHERGAYAGRTGGMPLLVLLDLKLPRLDGLGVLKAVREDPGLRHLAVVMLTSSNEERDVVQSYDLGVNSYVVKPVDFESFPSMVRSLGMFWAVQHTPYPHRSVDRSFEQC